MTEPILILGDNKWAIKENGILGYTIFDGFNNVDNYVANEFSFTRNTSSTVTNSQGLIEDSSYNLLQQSQTFTDVYWTKNLCTVTLDTNVKILGNSSYKLVVNSGETLSQIRRSVVVPQNNTNYVRSIYAKQGEARYIIFSAQEVLNSPNAIAFDLQTGVFTEVGVSIISYGSQLQNDGSYLIWIVSNADSALRDDYSIGISSDGDTSNRFIGDGVSGLYIWGAQLTQGSNLRPYLRTTNRLNVPTIDFSSTEIRRNLINFSEEFNNTTWITSGVGVSVDPNSITNPIDGNMNADKLFETVSSSTHRVIQDFNISGNNFTYSVYLKAAERNNPFIRLTDSAVATYTVSCNLTNGTVSTTSPNTTANIINVGNGWYRCILNLTGVTAIINAQIYVNTTSSYLGDGVSGVYAWGAQLETGSTATTYQKTTGINVSTGIYLLEPQRTNILVHSSNLIDTSWVNFNTVTSGNTAIAPDGTLTADSVISINSTNDFLYQQPTLASGITVAGSVFIKNVDALASTLFIRTNDTAFEGIINWGGTNLTSIQLVSGLTMTYDTFPNNWYRIKYSCITTEVNQRYRIKPDINNDGKRIYAWGAQLEVGPNVTSYIPTTTASVTRNGDTSYVDLSGRTLLNQSGWSLYWEGYNQNGQSTGMSVCLSDTSGATTNTNQIGWYNRLTPFINSGGTRTNGVDTTTVNTLSKFAIQYSAGTANFYVNGLKVWTQPLTPFNYRYLVVNNGNSTYTVKKLSLYDRTLSDSEAVTLTTTTGVFPFISTWNTNNTSGGSSLATQVKLPLIATGTYNMNVDWGDGTTNLITSYNAPETTHTYSTGGTYTVIISGTCSGWQFNNVGDRLKLMSITQWGGLRLTNLAGHFYGCANLMLNHVSDVVSLTSPITFANSFRSCTGLTTVNRINEWNTSGVTNLSFTFAGSINFNGNIGAWNTSNVTDIDSTFLATTAFNQNLNNWNVSNVTDMTNTFRNTNFNNGGVSLNSWNTSKVTTMNGTFRESSFNQDVSSWDVSKVINLSATFHTTPFNQNISSWNTVSATTMNSMFLGAVAFNHNIGGWNVSKVTDMFSMFLAASSFNQDLSNWNVSNVTNMSSMFQSADMYNNNGVSLNSWNVSNVTNMNQMLRNTSFNQDISSWNVSKVTSFGSMFHTTPFNQNIGSWNTSAATNMSAMFQANAAFDQNIGNWNVSNVINFTSFMLNKTPATFSTTNLDAIYNGWSSRPVQSGMSISFGTANYTAAGAAGKAILEGAPNNWTIVDGIQV